MSLTNTQKTLRELLAQITLDLEKAENGNKAASQRVRTGTVRLEKIAKMYRKESISSEKKTKGQKKTTKSASKGKSSASSSASKGKSSGSSSKGGKSSGSSKSNTSAKVKAKPKAKATKASFRPRQLSVKRATAKLPTRRMSAR